MKKFMLNILLSGLDTDTRMKLLPKEQEVLHGLEADGTVVHHFIKLDMSGIYMVVMAANEEEVHTKLGTLPYYPYMTIEITPIRAVNHINA
jgi:muconolactone delta-isomerase